MEIKISNISVKINGNLIFSNLSYIMNSGDMIALTGASGCGKTTLLWRDYCYRFQRRFYGRFTGIKGHGLSALGTRPTGKENRLVSLFEPLYGL